MAVANLTKRTVDAAKPAAKDVFLWDDELRGFGLKVTPKGSKVFVLQYRLGGRGAPTRRFTIGRYGPWTPQAAREEAKALLVKVDKGIDLSQEKADRERETVDLAFNKYADLFLAEYVRQNWRASYADAERIFRLHLKPALGRKPLPALRRTDITAVFDGIPKAQTALRRKVHAVLSRFFRWAVGRGDIARSPLEGMEAPPAPASRDRFLTDDELRLAWLAAGDLGYPFGPLYRLLILTGQRREEVSALDWKELDRSAATWRIPASRAKNNQATVVHLSAPAVAVLDLIADGEKWPKRGLVFSTTGETPVSGYSRAKSRLDAAMLKIAAKEAEAAGDVSPDLAPWRVHDLRRTLATGMQRLGVRFEVTEAVLNHVSGAQAGVAGIYQRHSWEPEKRDALNAWAARVERLVNGSNETNVIALAERRA
jgi:integrase